MTMTAGKLDHVDLDLETEDTNARRAMGVAIARLVAVRNGVALLAWRDRPDAPLAEARLASAITDDDTGAEVAVMFEDGDAARPLVIGIVQAPPFEDADAAGGEEPLIVESQREIVLRCGDASITLRPDGRVVIRGAYVETRARGVNRIKGGSVQIN